MISVYIHVPLFRQTVTHTIILDSPDTHNAGFMLFLLFFHEIKTCPGDFV